MAFSSFYFPFQRYNPPIVVLNRQRRDPMPFKLVYYSQSDPQWKSDKLGFGSQASDTIGYVGCALTSVAMVLSGHGYTVTPKALNQKLQGVNGFAGSGIRWYSVSQLYPQMQVNSIIKCYDTPAPLAQIDASLAKGQPAVVCVDSTPAPGLLTHYVVLIARKGNDYLMLDPWPYQPDVTKETYLMPRYSHGNPLQRSIVQIVLFENASADGIIQLPGQKVTSTGTPQTQPTSAPVSTTGPKARVKADVSLGLNIRTSEDTSAKANIVDAVHAGNLLTIIEPNGWTKIGAINQWVRVRTNKGREGLAAAWYLEKVPGETYPSITESTTSPASEAGIPSPTTAGLVVMVKAKVGAVGAKVYETASTRSKVVSKEAMRAKLTVIEDAAKAAPKVGKDGKWLYVQNASGAQGFVQADLVRTP
jgi:hypothetical protein